MLEVVLYALEMLKGMRRVPLCMPGPVEDELYLLEIVEVVEAVEAMRCVLRCIPEAAEGALETLEGMCRVPLCMREAVEDALYLLEVVEAMHCVLRGILEAVEVALCLLEMPEVMCCVLFCMLEAVDGGLCSWRYWSAGRALFCSVNSRLWRVRYVLLEAPEVPEVMRRVLLCMLEVVEGRLCLLEVLVVLEVL